MIDANVNLDMFSTIFLKLFSTNMVSRQYVIPFLMEIIERRVFYDIVVCYYYWRGRL